MSTTAAIIYALLSLAAIVAAVWCSFLLRDLCRELVFDDTDDAWKLLLFVPWLVLWIWCFILEIVLVIFTLWLGYQTAKDFRDWWHKGAK